MSKTIARLHVALLLGLLLTCAKSNLAATDAVDRVVLSRLDKVVTIKAGKFTLQQAIDAIAEQAGVRANVDWPTLQIVDIDPETTVWLELKAVPAKQVLEIALDQASADAFDDDKADFAVLDGQLAISTQRMLKTFTQTRQYSIRKYLSPRPADVTVQERLWEIGYLITRYVGDGDEWLDEESTLEERNARLTIKTSAKNHAAIVELFNMIDRPIDHINDLHNKLDRSAEARLKKRIRLKKQDLGLSEVIQFIRDATGQNIAVNWPSLEMIGVEPDSLVTIDTPERPADELLRLALDQVRADAGPDDVPHSMLLDGVVYIDTLRSNKIRTEVRVYKLKQWIGNQANNQQAVNEVINAIHENVGDLDAWLDEESLLDALRGVLVVKTTREHHRDIIKLLNKLKQ